MAYSQVAIYGMNKKVGLVSFPAEDGQFSKPYSDSTALMIDREVRTMVNDAYERTVKMLEEKKDLVKALAEVLLEKEVQLISHLLCFLLYQEATASGLFGCQARCMFWCAVHL